MFGLEGVPLNNFIQLEYRDRLEKLGSHLFAKSELIKKHTLSESADQLKVVSEELVPTESGTNPSGTEMGAETSVITEVVTRECEQDLESDTADQLKDSVSRTCSALRVAQRWELKRLSQQIDFTRECEQDRI